MILQSENPTSLWLLRKSSTDIFNRRSELLIAGFNLEAMAGKLDVPHEPAAAFLLVLLAVTLGHHALTA